MTTTANRPTVAELMRTWRRIAGLNSTAAGRRLGLTKSSIDNIEQGRRRADDELTRIALEALIRDARSS